MVEMIKVHVTAAQRELLEFLVNRRLNDLTVMPDRPKIGSGDEEIRNLRELQKELRHAGT